MAVVRVTIRSVVTISMGVPVFPLTAIAVRVGGGVAVAVCPLHLFITRNK